MDRSDFAECWLRIEVVLDRRWGWWREKCPALRPADFEKLKDQVLFEMLKNQDKIEPNCDRAVGLAVWIFNLRASTLCKLQSKRPGEIPIDKIFAISENDPSERLKRTEKYSHLQECLDELEEPVRVVVMLRHWEGLGFADIASSLGIGTTTAYERYGKALSLLLTCMDRKGYVD